MSAEAFNLFIGGVLAGVCLSVFMVAVIAMIFGYVERGRNGS